VFLVSHDRAFLDNVVTQTIASEGGGQWKEYVGGYSDWLRQRPAGGGRASMLRAESSPSRHKSRRRRHGENEAGAGKKLSFKEQRELEQLPARIAALEAEQGVLHARLADPAFYQEPAETSARPRKGWPPSMPRSTPRCCAGKPSKQKSESWRQKGVFFRVSSGMRCR
jgi:ATP-binding cassette subfamily F protein uup